MSENVNGISTWLTSGGHAWRWGPQKQTRSTYGTIAVAGEWSLVQHNGARPGRLGGLQGGPALMKASGANRAAVDAALDAYAAIVETLRRDGTEVAWEDDCGRTGTAMVITEFREMRRSYSSGGTVGWLEYEIAFLEMNGAY